MQTVSTRDRLIGAMSTALQQRGMNGIGLSEVLEQAGAPKGVLYHHFPGGKSELIAAAIEHTAQRMLAALDKLLQHGDDPIDAVQTWMQRAQQRLRGSGYECGCPLATVALESAADDTTIRAALATAFTAIGERMTAALVAAGQDRATAAGLAALIVAVYEGGLLQARAQSRLEPMLLASDMLLRLLQPFRHNGSNA